MKIVFMKTYFINRYQLYNLLCNGDELEALTVRNIHTCDRTNAVNKSKNRIQTKICIRIETIEYDDHQCSLRIKGVNIKENEYIKLGNCLNWFLYFDQCKILLFIEYDTHIYKYI